jgi:hypothetical protein
MTLCMLPETLLGATDCAIVASVVKVFLSYSYK